MPTKGRMSRDYIERTIAAVRNHRDAENCWPQWAYIFADEIERLWHIEDAAAHHAEECCRTDIGWREQMCSHDALVDVLARRV